MAASTAQHGREVSRNAQRCSHTRQSGLHLVASSFEAFKPLFTAITSIGRIPFCQNAGIKLFVNLSHMRSHEVALQYFCNEV